MRHIFLAALLASEPGPSGRQSPPAASPTFTRDVSPLLERWCVRCHGADEQEGGLRLDSYEALMRGGDSGPPVIARNAAASLLIAKVERRDRPPMPPRRHLPSSVVSKLRAWVDAGALP